MIAARVVPITEAHIAGFWAAVDVVARERKYLAFLEGPPLEMSRAFVLGNLAGNWPHFVALNDQDQVVGWCDITSLHRQTAEHVGVLGIGVLPDWRGRGIGESLMHAALRAAQNKGLTRVELSVHATNHRAVALYRKLGFILEGVKKNSVRIDNIYDDNIMMALLFDASSA